MKKEGELELDNEKLLSKIILSSASHKEIGIEDKNIINIKELDEEINVLDSNGINQEKNINENELKI